MKTNNGFGKITLANIKKYQSYIGEYLFPILPYVGDVGGAYKTGDNSYTHLPVDSIVYGVPYLHSPRKTFLRKSDKSRVKTFSVILDKYGTKQLLEKGKKKPITCLIYSHDFQYSLNITKLEEFDYIVRTVQSVKEAKTLKEANKLANLVTTLLEDFTKLYKP